MLYILLVVFHSISKHGLPALVFLIVPNDLALQRRTGFANILRYRIDLISIHLDLSQMKYFWSPESFADHGKMDNQLFTKIEWKHVDEIHSLSEAWDCNQYSVNRQTFYLGNQQNGYPVKLYEKPFTMYFPSSFVHHWIYIRERIFCFAFQGNEH